MDSKYPSYADMKLMSLENRNEKDLFSLLTKLAKHEISITTQKFIKLINEQKKLIGTEKSNGADDDTLQKLIENAKNLIQIQKENFEKNFSIRWVEFLINELKNKRILNCIADDVYQEIKDELGEALKEIQDQQFDETQIASESVAMLEKNIKSNENEIKLYEAAKLRSSRDIKCFLTDQNIRREKTEIKNGFLFKNNTILHLCFERTSRGLKQLKALLAHNRNRYNGAELFKMACDPITGASALHVVLSENNPKVKVRKSTVESTLLLQWVHFLLAQGAEPMLRDCHGDTPLHILVSHKTQEDHYLEVLKLLITKYPALLRSANNDNEFPLHIAAAKGWVEAVTLLLEYPYESSPIWSENGYSLLHMLVFKLNDNPENQAYRTILKQILAHETLPHCCINVCNNENLTPLALAVVGQNNWVVNQLLDHPAWQEIHDDKNSISVLIEQAKAAKNNSLATELAVRRAPQRPALEGSHALLECFRRIRVTYLALEKLSQYSVKFSPSEKRILYTIAAQVYQLDDPSLFADCYKHFLEFDPNRNLDDAYFEAHINDVTRFMLMERDKTNQQFNSMGSQLELLTSYAKELLKHDDLPENERQEIKSGLVSVLLSWLKIDKKLLIREINDLMKHEKTKCIQHYVRNSFVKEILLLLPDETAIIDLSGIDLTGVNLQGLDLQYVCFDNATVNELDIRGATNGSYDLCLMEDLPRHGTPKKDHIYFEKKNNQLRYIVTTPTDNIVNDVLDIVIEGDILTIPALNQCQPIILEKLLEKQHIRDLQLHPEQFLYAKETSTLVASDELFVKNIHILKFNKLYDSVKSSLEKLFTLDQELEKLHVLDELLNPSLINDIRNSTLQTLQDLTVLILNSSRLNMLPNRHACCYMRIAEKFNCEGVDLFLAKERTELELILTDLLLAMNFPLSAADIVAEKLSKLTVLENHLVANGSMERKDLQKCAEEVATNEQMTQFKELAGAWKNQEKQAITTICKVRTELEEAYLHELYQPVLEKKLITQHEFDELFALLSDNQALQVVLDLSTIDTSQLDLKSKGRDLITVYLKLTPEQASKAMTLNQIYQREDALRLAIKENKTLDVQRWLDCGVDVDAKDPEAGRTGLMIACAEKHVELIDYLLQRGADPNQMTDRDYRILMYVTGQMQGEPIYRHIAKTLCQHKAIVDLGSAVALAVFDENFVEIQTLFDATDHKILHAIDPVQRKSLLQVAIRLGSAELVKLLLTKYQFDPFLQDGQGHNAFYTAVRFETYPCLLTLFTGQDLNEVKLKDLESVFNYATERYFQCLQSSNSSEYAKHVDYLNMLALFKEQGVSPNLAARIALADKDYQVAVKIAWRSHDLPNREREAILLQIVATNQQDLLIDLPINNDMLKALASSFTVTKCLRVACQQRNLPILIMLYDMFSRFWTPEQTTEKTLALTFAAMSTNCRMIFVWLTQRPDFIQDRLTNGTCILPMHLGRTALHEAARLGNLEFVRQIVNLNVDVLQKSEKDNKGEELTALDVALCEGHTEIGRYLFEVTSTLYIRAFYTEEPLLIPDGAQRHLHFNVPSDDQPDGDSMLRVPEKSLN